MTDWTNITKSETPTEYKCDICRRMVFFMDIIFCECGYIMCELCKASEDHVKHRTLDEVYNDEC